MEPVFLDGGIKNLVRHRTWNDDLGIHTLKTVEIQDQRQSIFSYGFGLFSIDLTE